MENHWLEKFDRSVSSQRGEDGRIEKILQTIKDSDHHCVEFGAWDGLYNSNVLNLIKNHNYQAVMIEGSEKKYRELVENMKNYRVQPMHAFVGFDNTNSLDVLLKDTGMPNNFDLLSIDIDGNDYHAWKACTKFRPKVVVVEYNPTIPNEVYFVQEPVNHLNHGSSLRAFIELAKEKNYELVSANLNNAFFVDKKYFSLFNIADNSIDKIRTDKSRITYIFSGYDGRIFVRGWDKLDLHGIPYNEKRMQLLPRFLRGYDDSSAGFGRFKGLIKKTYRSMKKRNII